MVLMAACEGSSRPRGPDLSHRPTKGAVFQRGIKMSANSRRFGIVDIVGFIGMALIVGAYFLNSYEIVASKSMAYQLMNLFGAVAVGIDVYAKKAWSAFTLQVIWFLIGISAILTIIK